MNISAVIIVKNGINTIEKTLESLKSFTDVIVYDNGSSDGTQELVKKFDNVNLVEGIFSGFGPTKNKAASYAKNDWIIIIDSDEVIDEELILILKEKTLDDNTIYILNFKAFYKNIQIKHCGWNNQKIKRVYNKKHTSFNNNQVHENIIDKDFKTVELAGNIEHYSYSSISDFIIKVDRYSTLFAKDNAGKKYSSPLKAVFNGIYSFIKTYIFKRGFLDGYAGLIVSFSHMATNFYKYIKLYELNNELKNDK